MRGVYTLTANTWDRIRADRQRWQQQRFPGGQDLFQLMLTRRALTRF